MLYKTSVQWEDKHYVHYSFTYSDAVQWTLMYPAKDMIAVITMVFSPKPKAVRYYR